MREWHERALQVADRFEFYLTGEKLAEFIRIHEIRAI